MSVINTNITSMIGQQNLNESKNALTTSMERLSSGLRINSAKDDAAGQAIANRMTSQISGLGQAQRNANDGISIAQTAEGGLNQINDNLQRVRELTVQAQNGTNSASDIDSIQQEVNQRLEEIDRIARETDFNGTNVLDVDKETSIQIQVGSEDGQTINVTINDQKGWNQFSQAGTAAADLAEVGGEKRTVDAKGFDVLGGGSGTVTTTVDASSQTGLSNTGTTTTFESSDATGELYIKDVGTENVTVDASNTGSISGGSGTFSFVNDGGDLYIVDGDGSADADRYRVDASMVGAGGVVTADLDSLSAAATGFVTATDSADLTTATSENGTATATNFYEVTKDMVAEDGTGVITADLNALSAVADPGATTTQNGAGYTATVQDADGPLDALDSALAAVDVQRSELGAIQNRFADAISNLSTNETNLSAARSRIEDADYATEVANMTRAQILQQAGTSVLAQANQIPQSVLSLLG